MPGPRIGADEEVHADRHRADAAPRRTVEAVIQLETGQVIDVLAAFDERQNLRAVDSRAEQDVLAVLIRPRRQKPPQLVVQHPGVVPRVAAAREHHPGFDADALEHRMNDVHRGERRRQAGDDSPIRPISTAPARGSSTLLPRRAAHVRHDHQRGVAGLDSPVRVGVRQTLDLEDFREASSTSRSRSHAVTARLR